MAYFYNKECYFGFYTLKVILVIFKQINTFVDTTLTLSIVAKITYLSQKNANFKTEKFKKFD